MNNFSTYKKLTSLVGLSVIFQVGAFTTTPQQGFPINIPDSNSIRSGSPTVVDITGDDIPEIIIGDTAGVVYVYKSDGTELWRYDTGETAIESKPAVADIDLDGTMEIVVARGSNFPPVSIGGITVLNANGTFQCSYTSVPFSSEGSVGVYSSPSVANMDNDPELEFIFGDWGATVNVMNHDCSTLWTSHRAPAVSGQQLPPDFDETNEPYTIYVNDTVWSSPAIADMNKDGQLDVIIGVDTHIDDNDLLIDGGRLVVINGHNGTVQSTVDIDEVVYSSPAVVDLNQDGNLDMVVGSGYCWQFNECAPLGNTHFVDNKIYAFNANGTPLSGWPFDLGNYAIATSSPAIADIDGDGILEVIINAFDIGSGPPANGKIFVINSNGTLKWDRIPSTPAGGGNFVTYAASASSPIVADITGNGEMEVILPSNWDMVIWDKSGNQIAPIEGGDRLLTLFSVANTPTVADLDNDGDYELIAASSNFNFSPLPASIYVWDLDTPISTFLPWRSFRNGSTNQGTFAPNEIFLSGFE